MNAIGTDFPIQGSNEVDQCQLSHEALEWVDCKGDELAVLCFKIDHHGMQSDIKKFWR